MSGFQLPLTIDFGTFPTNFDGTPQEFADRLQDNARFFSTLQFALFVTGATAPSSDVGPWLANGNEWRVWDSDTGAYVPIFIAQESLRYFIGSSAPDEEIYEFWIETNGSGIPQALKIWHSGAWTDVYAATLSGYVTTAYLAANYSTTTQMNTAIAAAITAAAKRYPVRAEPSVTQTVLVDGNNHKVNFANVVFDPEDVWDEANSVYEAPVNGIYLVSAELQVDIGTAVASGMEMGLDGVKNGVTVVMSSGTSVASPPGGRWYPQFTSLVLLQSGDTMQIDLRCTDGTNTGDVTVSNSSVNIYLVQAT
jgi:hypothetical protein